MTYERLKQARELKGWEIGDLARRTGLRPHTLEAIERGDFADLPAGLYCRSSIRSFATAVGLNPDEVLESVRPFLPVPEDPLDGLARRHGHARKSEPRAAEPPAQASYSAARIAPQPARVAKPAAPPVPVAPEPGLTEPLMLEPVMVQPAVVEPMAVEPVTAEPVLVEASYAEPVVFDPVLARTATNDEALDFVLEDAAPRIRPAADRSDDCDEVILAPAPSLDMPSAALASATVAPRLAYGGGRQWWRALAASAIDGLLLAAMGGALVWLTAIACDTSVTVALRIAGPAMALVFALIVALYFVLFGGVGNATLGVMLMRLDAPIAGRTVLNARDVFGRARRSVFRDDSLLVD